jgi:DNA polymerase elongation subunit (family B)
MDDHDYIQPETASSVELPDFIDIAIDEYDGKTELQLLTEDGIEYHPIPFLPYFYVDDGVLSHSVNQILDTVHERPDFDAVKVYDVSANNGDFHRISTYTPSSLRELAEDLDDHGVTTYESDIPYERQVMVNCEQPVVKPERSLSFDLEVRAPDGVPNPTSADQRILSIAGVGSDGREWVWSHDSERETVKAFLDTAREYRCVIGWNSETFDWPYLINRCARLGILFEPFSIVHLDAMAIYKHVLSINQPSYALDTVANAEFDEQYGDDIEYDRLGEYFESNREKLREYNRMDAEIVHASMIGMRSSMSSSRVWRPTPTSGHRISSTSNDSVMSIRKHVGHRYR